MGRGFLLDTGITSTTKIAFPSPWVEGSGHLLIILIRREGRVTELVMEPSDVGMDNSVSQSSTARPGLVITSFGNEGETLERGEPFEEEIPWDFFISNLEVEPS